MTGDESRVPLLAAMRRVGGEWTGTRVARWWKIQFDMEITHHRGDEHLMKLLEQGHLVQTRPPRGRTFILAEPVPEEPAVNSDSRFTNRGTDG